MMNLKDEVLKFISFGSHSHHCLMKMSLISMVTGTSDVFHNLLDLIR